MTGRERFLSITQHQSTHCGFWHGHPHEDALDGLLAYFGAADDFELGLALGDDVCWCMPEENGLWLHPGGRKMFDFWKGRERHSLGEPGCFADCEDPAEVEAFEWPTLQHCDFSGTLALIERARSAGLAVLSGMWSPFFHDVADAFGMEEYFIKMYTAPEVVQAVTEKVVGFYEAASRSLFELAGDSIDAFFFGNDFGSQLSTLISPECFDSFVMPSFRRLVGLAKAQGCQVVLHSCGSIFDTIPSLIEAGVDVLHPIQAKAAHMDAETLQNNFGGKIAFMGGIDAQHLMTFGSPEDIRREVARVRAVFGPNYIVSPSHECILPNVPPENLAALAQAAAL